MKRCYEVGWGWKGVMKIEDEASESTMQLYDYLTPHDRSNNFRENSSYLASMEVSNKKGESPTRY